MIVNKEYCFMYIQRWKKDIYVVFIIDNEEIINRYYKFKFFYFY